MTPSSLKLQGSALRRLLLLRLVQPARKRADAQGQLLIKDKISRQDLAKMVGASREMVSRVMKDLEERGFIQTQDNGSIVVKDRLSTLG